MPLYRSSHRNIADVTYLITSAHPERTLDGVTFSGGEPMQQPDELLALIESLAVRRPDLSFGMYSGYSERELSIGRYWCRSKSSERAKQAMWRSIRHRLDFAILGKYSAVLPSALPLRTSANQKLVLFSRRYREQDFGVQEVEVQIDNKGAIQVTGFPTAGIPA